MLAPSWSGLCRWLHAIATYDFLPRFSAQVRRFLYNPLGVLLAAGASSLLCGLLLQPQVFVLSGGILAVLAFGVLWPWLSLRGLSGSVAFDRTRASEGEAVEVCLILRNLLPWSAWALAVRAGFGGPPAEVVAGVVAVPRWRTVRCRWSFVPPCRGVYPLSAPQLTTGFPFGMWDNRRSLAVETRLVVWPRTFPVGPIPPVSGDHQVEGNVSRSKVGANGDVLGVRPYRRGDSPRRIHWGQSARHDRLIVCELESNCRPLIQLVLDADPQVHVGTGPDSSREWAIRIVASFAKGWLEDGAQVGLAWGGHDIPPASGRAQVHLILDALAALPDAGAKPLADVLACPHCRGFRDGLQVIVTTDRALVRDGCGARQAENQRWVVLNTRGLAGSVDEADVRHGPTPWLWIESAQAVSVLLKGGWREARHGS